MHFEIVRQFYIKTRKSSCVNARGIPTAAYHVLHLLTKVGYPSIQVQLGGTPPWVPQSGYPPLGTLVGVPPVRLTPSGYPQLGYPLSGYPPVGVLPIRVPPVGVPQSRYPLSGYPLLGYPSQGTPWSGYPLLRYPPSGVPHRGTPLGWTWLGYPPPVPGSGTHLGVDRQMDGWTDTCQNITFPSYYVRGR